MPRSKRYKKASAIIDKKKLYTVSEAAELAKQTASTKFDSSVEVHAKLGIDTKQSDQLVRGIISLPHSFGKSKIVAAFVDSEKVNDAKAAGADIIADDEFIAKLATSGKIEFDVAVATPSMMPKIAKLAKLLGPRGLMPNPKTETVSDNVTKMIKEQKGGKISFKNDSTGNIHQIIGKASLSAAEIEENFNAFVNILKKSKPPSSKGIFLRKVVLTTTMGPAIQVAVE
ncbi:MAG: 50S ribosomal protein L1 [uncultured bacterium]|nr:MAG: 50S ribosomal protein L1 [uncultured bacterium]HBD05406.1 50S ribosomal protein L1 [Candidatus Uhrbacteria bacterium]